MLGDNEYTGIFTDAFLYIGRGRLFGEIPFPIVLFLLVAVVAWVVLDRTRWGRQLYAIGGNLEAGAAGRRARRPACG